MNLTESERNSPSAMSESHSPMATQLAAFTPFPIENAQASDTVTPPARHQDPFENWGHHAATGVLPMQPPQTFLGANPMSPSHFLGQTSQEAASHAGSTRFSTGNGPQSNWVAPASFRSSVGLQGSAVSRPSLGRRFIVRNVPTDIEGLDILKLFSEFPGLNGPQMFDLSTQKHFHVSFLDIRDAKRFVEWITTIQHEWELFPAPADEFSRKMRYTVHLPIQFDDMNLVTVYCGNHSNVQGSEIVSLVKPILDLVGSVHSITEFNLGTPSLGLATVHELIVRWYNTSHATNAIKTLNGIRTQDFVIEVMPWHHGMEEQPIKHWTAFGMKNRRDYDCIPRPACMSPGANLDFSPPRFPDRSRANNAYLIDVHRIYYGHDKRTTIMLRNVPFPMSCAELEEILNETSAQQYDFLYLRVDFETKKNVGYAFVNFAHPKSIIPFVESRQGIPWPGYTASRSDHKVAEMSYATIQGKDALIEKFRNSPVMLSAPEHRPKVYNLTGPRAGQETGFPTVNNFYILSKGIELGQRNGLYRSGSRVDPRPRRRCWSYSDNGEGMVAEGEFARASGSPIRTPHRFNTFTGGTRAPRTSLQEWMASQPRTG